MEERVQSVLFMRHAVALHNVATTAHHHSAALSSDPAWVDPELTPYGKLQAVVAGGLIRTHWSIQRQQETTDSFMSTDSATTVAVVGSSRGRVGLELVVASPLTRCLQTATLAFLPPFMAYDDNGDDDANNNGDVPPPPPPAVAMVCKEEVREAFGIQYPDRRRAKSVLQVRACVLAHAVPLTELRFECS
jgi:hypothetical protein